MNDVQSTVSKFVYCALISSTTLSMNNKIMVITNLYKKSYFMFESTTLIIGRNYWFSWYAKIKSLIWLQTSIHLLDRNINKATILVSLHLQNENSIIRRCPWSQKNLSKMFNKDFWFIFRFIPISMISIYDSKFTSSISSVSYKFICLEYNYDKQIHQWKWK